MYKIVPFFKLKNRYSVFALGSSAYPHFCGFGKWLDEILFSLGGERLSDLALGDDLGDRDNAFKVWLLQTYQRACLSSGVQHKTTNATEVAVRWFTPEKANSAEDLTIFSKLKVLQIIVKSRHPFIVKYSQSTHPYILVILLLG